MTSYMFPPVRRDEGMQGENAARFSAEEAGRYMVEKECIALTPEQRHERAVKVTEHVKRMEEILSDPQREKPECGKGIICQAGRSSFWITWDGRMKICGLTSEPEADVRELGIRRGVGGDPPGSVSDPPAGGVQLVCKGRALPCLCRYVPDRDRAL